MDMGVWRGEVHDRLHSTISRGARVHRKMIEDEGAVELGLDHNLTTT